jgi:ABC-type nitrate/sulfonate/bicarbonate transport system substrate-binding protein
MNPDLIKSLIGCLLLLPILITGTAAAQEKIKAGISSFSASYISMFIANKRGYYAEEGMSVDIILIAGLLGTRALIGGSVEFGSASNPTAAVQGAKLKMLMVFNEKPHSALFAQPGIKSVAELRGKKIGGSTVGSLEYGWIKELLPKFGLQLGRDVTFLAIGPTATRFAALKTATVDAAPLSPPSSFLAQDAGFPVLTRVSDHVEDIQACIATTDERLAPE